MKKVLFCTPSHDGKVVVDYVKGCLDIQKNCHETDFYVDFFWQEHGSDIVKSREDMFWFWYHETEHDYMLFMDSDQGFTAQTIRQLFNSAERAEGKAILAAPVPQKEMKEQRIIEYVMEAIEVPEAPFSREGMLPSTWDYNFMGDHRVGEGDGNPIVAVERVGTGCMLIPRGVVDKIVTMIEEVEGHFSGSDPYESRVTKKTCYTMFSHLIMGGKILGEDYSFCIRMLLADVPVLVDTRCNLTHFGTFAFKGDFSEKMEFLKHMNNTTNNTP
jgi:hypothetical protein